ncbi:MAG: hypothetical protein AAF614_14840 [Chloroflexota bacterium]
MQAYTPFIRFLLPLALTTVVQQFSLQILNGGMARMPQATETLAAFGLAWGLVTFVSSPLWPMRSMALVLVNGRSTYHTLIRFLVLLCLLLAAIISLLTFGPISYAVIEQLHALEANLGGLVRETLFWLIPYPFVHGAIHFCTGLLLRVKRTVVTSYATLTGIGLSITAVFFLLDADFVRQKPIWLPLLITYIAILPEALILLWGFGRYVWRQLAPDDEPVTYRYAARYVWPLIFVMLVQSFSRPLINLFIAREPNGADTLAVLTVVYALALIPYNWLNDLRSLWPAFRERPLSQVRRFVVACGMLSFSIMIGLYWTGLRTLIVADWIGLPARLVPLATIPLMLSIFFPLVVASRAYLVGIALTIHQTQVMTPSAPARLAMTFFFLLLLPLVGINGATRAIVALLSGFFAETAVVWWGLQRQKKQRAFEIEPV